VGGAGAVGTGDDPATPDADGGLGRVAHSRDPRCGGQPARLVQQDPHRRSRLRRERHAQVSRGVGEDEAGQRPELGGLARDDRGRDGDAARRGSHRLLQRREPMEAEHDQHAVGGRRISRRGIGGRDYETGKAAVLHFTRCAAADWAPHGITVNAICPGLFMTDTNREWNERRPEVIEAFVKNVPMGRTGEPDEIGPLAVYLASPAAAYVTGAAYVIDGGYTLW